MKKKKLIMAIVVIFLVITAIFGALFMSSQKDEEPTAFVSSFVYKSDFTAPSYIFYDPDYESDIFSDADYLKYVPYIYYTRGTVTKCITDEDYTPYGDTLVFFGKYFDALKAGDTETFISLHTRRYFENNRNYEKIAPQKLYNINVEYITSADIDDPDYGKVTKYLFKTSYMILKNDGTFRSDIGSDASRPQYLELVEINGNLYADACGDRFELPE